MGSCIRTVHGEERVATVEASTGRGVYTVVTTEPYIVVNGIIATPVGGVNPTMAHLYYNLHRLVYAFAPKALLSAQAGLQQAMAVLGSAVL